MAGILLNGINYSGGGDSIDAVYAKTLLYSNDSGAPRNTAVTLSDNVDKYDALLIVHGTVASGGISDYYMEEIIDTDELVNLGFSAATDMKGYCCYGYSNRYFILGLVSLNQFHYLSASPGEQDTYNPIIYKVYGITYDGNLNEKGYKKELVYDSGSDTVPAPSSPSLSDITSVSVNFLKDVSEYDQLMIVYNSLADGGLTNSVRTVFIDKGLIENGKPYDHADYYQRWFRFVLTSNTTFSYFTSKANEGTDQYPRIFKIYGIKFGGGSSVEPPTYNETMDILEGE